MNHQKEIVSVPGLLRNLIKLCRFSKTESDSAQFPVQQVSYLDKAGDALVAMPYGSHANIPENALGALFQISEQEQNRAVLPISPGDRPHPIESGEVVYFHPATGTKIHFKSSGDIDISTIANLNIVAATQVQITAPNISLIGSVTVSGSLAVSGTLSQGGKDVGKDHTHAQPNDGAGDAEANTTGVI